MMETNLITLIGNVGFPIAVAAYLLVRIESKLEALTNAINSLAAKNGQTTQTTQTNQPN